MSREEEAIKELKTMYLLHGQVPIRRYHFQYFDLVYFGGEFEKAGYIKSSKDGKFVTILEKVMEV